MSEVVLSYEATPTGIGANMVALFVDTLGRASYVGQDAVAHVLATTGNDVDVSFRDVGIGGNLLLAYTNSVTVGNQTVNSPSGMVVAGVAASQLQVTCNYCTANSHVIALPAANDVTGRVTAVVPTAGNFVIHMTAPTANMPITFVVVGR